jgi:hypothetical protein
MTWHHVGPTPRLRAASVTSVPTGRLVPRSLTAPSLPYSTRALARGCSWDPAWSRVANWAADTWPALSTPPMRSRSSPCSSIRSTWP